MAEGMPYFKSSKTPVENSEDNLEDIEKQACLLFEEFLRLAEPVRSFGGYAKFEPSDSPVVHENKQWKARGKVVSLKVVGVFKCMGLLSIDVKAYIGSGFLFWNKGPPRMFFVDALSPSTGESACVDGLKDY